MVEAAIFIPLIIVAFTQMLKMALPQITGWVTIIIALVIGVLVGLIGGLIGVEHVTIAQGIVYALEAIGVSVIAGKAGGGASGDGTVVK